MGNTYDESEDLAGSSLASEYDDTFSSDERLSQLLKLSSDAFKREIRTIKISEIAYTDPIKKGRQDTLSGMTAIVKDLGVLTPIHVRAVPEEDAEEDYKYILLDGLRRIYAATRNGQKEIDAVVWTFNDEDTAADLGLYISLILNKTQKRSWREIWHLYQVLELQGSITPNTLENILQLESGEAMKLRDVMLCSYDEIKEALLSGDKPLDACYKMLEKKRKEEDRLAEEDASGVDQTFDEEGNLISENDGMQLSDEDTKELLDMADDLDDLEDVDEDDFGDMNKSQYGDDQQQVGDRHPLDPALRNAVVNRDQATCKCCGKKMVGVLSGILAVHHVIPVHCGGKDTMDNLVTLCVGCHIALHLMERNGGMILMSKEQFDGLDEPEQTSLKRALKLARVAIKADKHKGFSKEDVQSMTKDAIRHPMPGTAPKVDTSKIKTKRLGEQIMEG